MPQAKIFEDATSEDSDPVSNLDVHSPRALSDSKQLEFLWETGFKRKTTGKEAIMCHMAPFDLYSIKHACGPDKQVL